MKLPESPLQPVRAHRHDQLYVRSNPLCNLGYGDPAQLFARSPRLNFEDACVLLKADLAARERVAPLSGVVSVRLRSPRVWQKSSHGILQLIERDVNQRP
jgi:hypothetical protein